MSGVTLHMTATQKVGFHNWVAFCRCGWVSERQPNQHEARKVGDRHLAEANAADNKPSPICGYCSAPSAGTIHGWPLCTAHLAAVNSASAR